MYFKDKDPRGSLSAIYYIVRYYKYHEVEPVTYFFNENYKFCDLYLKRQMRKCYANANVLLRKFVKCSPDVKCYLFKSYCCNLFFAPIWYDSTKAAMKNLKVVL